MFSPCLLLTLVVGAGPSGESKSRTFEFTYAATVGGLMPQQSARIWLPVPSNNDEQKIEILTPLADAKLTKEKFYGNRLYYLEAKADGDGKIPLSMAFKVTRKEVHSLTAKDSGEDAAKIGRFLQPDKLVPIDGIGLVRDGHFVYARPDGSRAFVVRVSDGYPSSLVYPSPDLCTEADIDERGPAAVAEEIRRFVGNRQDRPFRWDK